MNILVIQLRRIGDILLTTPAVAYLRQVLPGAQIDFLCEPAGLNVLESNKAIRQIHVYASESPLDAIRQVRYRRYDVVIDFMNNPRSRLLTGLSGAKWRVGFAGGPRGWLYNVRMSVLTEPEYVPKRKIRLIQHWLRGMGKAAPDPITVRPVLVVNDDEKKFADQWLKENGLSSRQFAVMAPAQRHETRQWRPQGFAEVGRRLATECLVPVFLGWGPGEENLMKEVQRLSNDSVKLLPPTTMRQMAAIFRHAKFLLTNCSGPMHTAVAVGTPTVTIYGPTRPVDWNPSLADAASKETDLVLTADGVPCLGCHLNRDCPSSHACMMKLDADKVFKICQYLIK